MKKTVVLAIFIAYIASILIVQFFGLKVVEMKGNIYISAIEVSGMEYTNRDGIEDYKYKEVVQLKDSNGKLKDHYAGYFYPGTYDETPESLATNPNRVKILYQIVPYDASNQEISYAFDEKSIQDAVYFDQETKEFVFLKPRSVHVILSSLDGSTVTFEVSITLVP